MCNEASPVHCLHRTHATPTGFYVVHIPIRRCCVVDARSLHVRLSHAGICDKHVLIVASGPFCRPAGRRALLLETRARPLQRMCREVRTALVTDLGTRCHRVRKLAPHRVALPCYTPNPLSSRASEHRCAPSFHMRKYSCPFNSSRIKSSCTNHRQHQPSSRRRSQRRLLQQQLIRTLWPRYRKPTRRRPSTRPVRGVGRRCICAVSGGRHAYSGRIRRHVRFRFLLSRKIDRDTP